MIDEGPSADDLERFSEDTAYCPECGAEISDLSEFCPQCGAAVSGRLGSRPPTEAWFRQRWKQFVVILVLIGFVVVFVLFRVVF